MNAQRCFALCAVLTGATAALPALAITPNSSRRTLPAASSTPELLPAPRDLEVVEPLPVEDVARSPITEREDACRYRYHLGRWWYYVEPKHWLFWDGQCWQDARPQTPKIRPDGSVQRVGLMRRSLAAWPQVPSYREHHGWIGGFYSSGGGYGSSGFGYGYGIPSYGPGSPYVKRETPGSSWP
jgi:hypothetical protein